jgi:hypothetical protein
MVTIITEGAPTIWSWLRTDSRSWSTNHDSTISSLLKTDLATNVEYVRQSHDPSSQQMLWIWHVVQWENRTTLNIPYINTSQLDR